MTPRDAIRSGLQRMVWLAERAKFYALWLPVMAHFKLKERAALRAVSPRIWLSPAELIEKDLELYDEVDGFRIDKALLDDLIKARTSLLEKIGKRLILSTGVFVFLFGNFLSIKVDYKFAGFGFTYGPGIPEGLLLISNILAVHTLMMQNSLYIIDSTIRFIIKKIVPPELHQIYLVKIFSLEHFPPYNPFNLPHITPAGLSSFVVINTARLFLIMMGISAVIYLLCNFWMLIDLINDPKLGWVSIFVALYIFTTGIVAFLYVLMTRMKLPYNDYTSNHELELLGQINPDFLVERRREMFASVLAIRDDMVRRGYLKEK